MQVLLLIYILLFSG